MKDKIRIIKKKKKIVEILSSPCFAPANALPDVFIGKHLGEYIFADAEIIKELTSKKYLLKTIKEIKKYLT